MQSKKKSRYLKFLKEIAIIVIGVLIAVSINKIKENADDKKYIKKTLTAIQKENDHSRKETENVLKSHYLLADTLKTKLENEETLSEIIFALGGIKSPETKNIGLRFFISNKADLLDYDVISHLSEIETSSKLLETKMERLVDHMFSNIEESDQKSKQILLHNLNNVINTEKKLLHLYSKSFQN